MDKLQQLTDRLYNEGLSKGKQEGEAIVSEARRQAEEILRKAKAEAGDIIAKAEKEAADYKTKVESDLRMASDKTIQATRKDIENLVISKISDAPVGKALTESEFVKETITAVARNFSTQESQDIALVLPDALRRGLEPFVENELGKMLGKGVDATFSKKIAGGFKIGPKDGSYFISMTDETFKDLISEYLRPATCKLLFGDK